MFFSIFKKKVFSPDFPVIPLKISEADAIELLSNHGVVQENQDHDSHIVQKEFFAENEDTRIDIGIWDGKVRFVNYLTSQFNATNKLLSIKLGWFVEQYGGWSEFEGPNHAGMMVICPNEKRNITIMLGLTCGPIRILDQDPKFYEEKKDEIAQ